MPRGGKRQNAGRKRGSKNRPKFQLAPEATDGSKKPTPAQRMRELRRRVALLVADGMAAEAIAAVMSIDIEKLRTLFAHELEHGCAIIRAQVLIRLDAAGDGGSVSADRALESLTASTGTPAVARSIGKKAAAHAAAAAAAAGGNMFAPPTTPRGIGKKEFAQAMAEDAHVGTAWGDSIKELGGEKPN